MRLSPGARQEVYNDNNVYDNMIRYSCCGEVIIKNLDCDTKIWGYMLEEINKQWKVQLSDNSTVYILVPIYNNDTNS